MRDGVARRAAPHAAGPRDRHRRSRSSWRSCSSASPSARVPPFLAVVDTVAGLALAAGAAYFLVPADRAREAPPALARPPQADPLVHLHRLRSGHPDRRLLPAVRLPAVLQLQLVPRAEPSARAERARARFVAQSTALEIQRARRPRRRRQSSRGGRRPTRRKYPGVSIAVVPVRRTCVRRQRSAATADSPQPATSMTAGPWAHVDRRAAFPRGRLRRLHRRLRVLRTGPDAAATIADTHLLVRARRVSRCARSRATPSSSTCWSTSAIARSSCGARPASSSRASASRRQRAAASSRWPARRRATPRRRATSLDAASCGNLPAA